jgi:hypothetical protein
MTDKQVLLNAPAIQREFQSAVPFHHVKIDNFLQSEIAEVLLRDFPSFDKQKALNELGQLGGKAVVENVRDVSPFYASFFDLSIQNHSSTK